MIASASWLGVAWGVGVLQSLAPDHWLPAQLKTWREGKSSWVALARMGGLLALQALAGVALYLLFSPLLLKGVEPEWFFVFALSFLFLFALLRERAALRVWGIGEPIGGRSQVRWKQILLTLGPAEYLVPLLLKTEQAGVGVLAVALCFLAGMLTTGLATHLWCQRLWMSPYLLSSQVGRSWTQGVWVPAVAMTALFVVFWAG